MTPLRRRMTEDMQPRNLSPNTQQAYAENVARVASHLDRLPHLVGPERIGSYLLHLATVRKPSASTITVAVVALRLLYCATLGRHWNADVVVPISQAAQEADGHPFPGACCHPFGQLR